LHFLTVVPIKFGLIYSWRNYSMPVGKMSQPFRIEFQVEYNLVASADQSDGRIRDVILLAIDNIGSVGCDVVANNGTCFSYIKRERFYT
jgi:hypothetical protein